jgi:hypothetical protein
MTPAQTLLPSARGQLTPAFRQNQASVDLKEFLRPVTGGRDIPVAELGRLLAAAQERFAEDPPRSDRWLAPRIHALLRLSRSEAGDKQFWGWLAAVEFPDYARWRFPGKGEEEEDEARRGTPVKRFTGQDRDNALSRLWWGGELCRNGADYRPVEAAFMVQDVPSTWFSLDAFHHPACAQAALRLLPRMQGRPVNRLATALDHVLTTIQLDVVAPSAPPDTQAILDWRDEDADIEALLEDELPTGPDETATDPDHIDAVERLIRRVAQKMRPPLDLPAS